MLSTPKSEFMNRAEAMEGKPLKESLPMLFYELGYQGLQKRWGISKSTVNYWIYKYGFETKLILVKREK